MAIARSRPKSWMLASGRRMSRCNRLIRSPPTQYSNINQRWFVDSYLRHDREDGDTKWSTLIDLVGLRFAGFAAFWLEDI